MDARRLGYLDAMRKIKTSPYMVCPDCGVTPTWPHLNHCPQTPIWADIVRDFGEPLDRIAINLAASRAIKHWTETPLVEVLAMSPMSLYMNGFHAPARVNDGKTPIDPEWTLEPGRWTLPSFRWQRERSIGDVLKGIDDPDLRITIHNPNFDPYPFTDDPAEKCLNILHRMRRVLRRIGVDLLDDPPKALEAAQETPGREERTS